MYEVIIGTDIVNLFYSGRQLSVLPTIPASCGFVPTILASVIVLYLDVNLCKTFHCD